MQIKNYKYFYLKSTRSKKTPDYLVENKTWIIEIGGKAKGREQFKGID
ncbi:MAG TPA: hypothetical protein VKS21_09135 [Spirochaetota bacterium]|nr:hypothetical protein [Spirochaetota bacterium]